MCEFQYKLRRIDTLHRETGQLSSSKISTKSILAPVKKPDFIKTFETIFSLFGKKNGEIQI